MPAITSATLTGPWPVRNEVHWSRSAAYSSAAGIALLSRDAGLRWLGKTSRRGAAPPGVRRGGPARDERRGKAVPVKGEGEAGGAPQASGKHSERMARDGNGRGSHGSGGGPRGRPGPPPVRRPG